VLEATGFRAAVVRLVLADLVPRWVLLLVAIGLLPTNQDIEVYVKSSSPRQKTRTYVCKPTAVLRYSPVTGL